MKNIKGKKHEKIKHLLTFITFVDVNVALGTNVAAGATAGITTVDHTRLAD